MKGANIKKQLTIITPKIVPLVTEIVTKKKSILKNQSGDTIILKPHQMTRELRKFLEKSGFTIEYQEVQRMRGKSDINGVIVEVKPIMHTHYDGGVTIRIEEESPESFENTNKILEFLTKNGINLKQECQISENKACLFKSK